MNNFQEEVNKLKKKVMEYVHGTLDGRIVAGETMKRAMKRFLKDLKNPEYYIDWNEVFVFYNWAHMFKHTKGVLAGQYVDLHDSQLWEMTNILGFKRVDTNLRRYKEIYIQKGRKNGKTQELAFLASYVAFLSNETEEVYIAGWTKEQSNLCYNEVLAQISKVAMLKDKFKDTYHKITVKKNNSTIVALSKEARKSGDGTNPSLSIIDEYGTSHQTNEIVESQRTGQVGRAQPLVVFITTAGLDLSVPCYEMYKYCKNVLDPELESVQNEELFVAIYEPDEGDDIKSHDTWKKANPIVMSHQKGVEAMERGLKIALDVQTNMRSFLTKNLNIWVDHKENGYIPLKKWNATTILEDEKEEFMQGANFYYGVDLSITTDLTALGWVAVKNGEFLCGQRAYMPEERFHERLAKDKVPFDVFEERGELVLTPGEVVDYNYIKNDLLAMANKYGCKQVGFDRYNATYVATEFQNEGLEVVEIPQSIAQLSEPTKKFREYVYNGKMKHTDDQLLSWAINNAVLQEDTNENIKINKSRSKDRIDPVDAIMNAFARAMYDPQVNDLNEIIMEEDWSF